jgi:hypothetical protein
MGYPDEKYCKDRQRKNECSRSFQGTGAVTAKLEPESHQPGF